MHTVEEIIQQARRLSLKEQKRLVEELEESLTEESERERSSPEGPYARSLAFAGSVHTDFPDVSADKYKHLAEAYADKDDER